MLILSKHKTDWFCAFLYAKPLIKQKKMCESISSIPLSNKTHFLSYKILIQNLTGFYKMKQISFIVAIIITLSIFGFTYQFPTDKEEIKWETDFDAALKIAKKENKEIFILFTGSDWCYWCKKLDGEVFSKEDFTKYANENFVCLKLDFPRKSNQTQAEREKNSALAQQYGIQGFPTVLIMSSSKEVLHETGYQSGGSKNYIEQLNKVLSKSK